MDRVRTGTRRHAGGFVYQKKGLKFAPLKTNAVQGKPESMDWWAPETRSIRAYSVAEFRETMGIQNPEPIAEGMVYWFRLRNEAIDGDVLRATVSARALAKDLYARLL